MVPSGYMESLLLLVGINVIAAVSYNLINGFTGQFSLGHAGFMAVGGFTAAILTRDHGWGIAPAFLCGGLMAAFIGLIVGWPTLRLKGDYLAIATLGVGEIIRVVITNLTITGGAQGLAGVPSLRTLTGARGWTEYYDGEGLVPPDWIAWLPILYLFICVAITVAVIWNLVHSAPGRAIVSVREDEVAAEAMGVNTTRYKVMAFVIGSFFAGLAGAWQVHRAEVAAAEEFNIFRTIELLIFIVFGGLGSITGSIVAATGLTFLTEELKDLSKVPAVMQLFGSAAAWWDQVRLWVYGTFGVLNPRNLPNVETTGLPVTPYQFSLGPLWRALFSLLLIFIMLVRPSGLLGRWELPYIFRRRRQRELQLAAAGIGPVGANLEEPTAHGHQDPAITTGLHPVGEESTDVTRKHETGEGRGDKR